MKKKDRVFYAKVRGGEGSPSSALPVMANTVSALEAEPDEFDDSQVQVPEPQQPGIFDPFYPDEEMFEDERQQGDEEHVNVFR